MAVGGSNLVEKISAEQCKKNIPEFRPGDTLKVHTRIIEGTKERIQIFEGVVLKRSKKSSHPSATFTVRKISYNIGVERTFFLHSPRIERIEIVRQGRVRRARLFYLRPLRGKAARIKGKYLYGMKQEDQPLDNSVEEEITPELASDETAEQAAEAVEAEEPSADKKEDQKEEK